MNAGTERAKRISQWDAGDKKRRREKLAMEVMASCGSSYIIVWIGVALAARETRAVSCCYELLAH